MGKIKNIVKKISFIIRKDIRIKISAYVDRKTILEGYNRLGKFVDVRSSFLGYGSYISDNSNLTKTKIGRFCSIASNVRVRIGRHPTREFVSTHPAFFSIRKHMQFSFVKKNKFEEFRLSKEGYSVIIGNDVWIGSDVIILEGVTIGDGAIIGAGCVVSKDVEAYAIYVGNPMIKVRDRFSEVQKIKLLKLKWWNKDVAWIKKHSEYFDSIDKFLKKINA